MSTQPEFDQHECSQCGAKFLERHDPTTVWFGHPRCPACRPQKDRNIVEIKFGSTWVVRPQGMGYQPISHHGPSSPPTNPPNQGTSGKKG